MLPIKQRLFTFAPKIPIQITVLAVVTPKPAEAPNAVLKSAVVLLKSA
jgi:hypothetical protein